MRLFTAIGISELSFDPKIEFKKVKVNLLKKEIEHRWVPIENYHCTLNFLGEVDLERLSDLKLILSKVSFRHGPFSLKLEGMSAFPDIQEGRVLYLGVQNKKELRSLQSDCQEELRGTFRPEERPYVPHLTVARLRNPRNLKDIISPVHNKFFGELKVSEITLYESVSHGAFPVYRPIEAFPLSASHE